MPDISDKISIIARPSTCTDSFRDPPNVSKTPEIKKAPELTPTPSTGKGLDFSTKAIEFKTPDLSPTPDTGKAPDTGKTPDVCRLKIEFNK